MPWLKKASVYEEQILRILLGVGARGISVKKLAKHVYNHYCTFFFQPDFRDVYRAVQQYVQRQTRSKQGLLEHAERWGHYRLNTTCQTARQLMLDWESSQDEAIEKEEERVVEDRSLNLFDF